MESDSAANASMRWYVLSKAVFCQGDHLCLLLPARLIGKPPPESGDKTMFLFFLHTHTHANTHTRTHTYTHTHTHTQTQTHTHTHTHTHARVHTHTMLDTPAQKATQGSSQAPTGGGVQRTLTRRDKVQRPAANGQRVTAAHKHIQEQNKKQDTAEHQGANPYTGTSKDHISPVKSSSCPASPSAKPKNSSSMSGTSLSLPTWETPRPEDGGRRPWLAVPPGPRVLVPEQS